MAKGMKFTALRAAWRLGLALGVELRFHPNHYYFLKLSRAVALWLILVNGGAKGIRTLETV